jgi:glucose/arabinose dehydrogenase
VPRSALNAYHHWQQLTNLLPLLLNPAMFILLRRACCLAAVFFPAFVFAAEQPPAIRLQLFAEGLKNPVHVWHDGTARLFIVEQAGTIRIVKNGRLVEQPFLDIRDRVLAGGECGLLSIAFHPKFQQNGRFFLNYTTRDAQRQIFTVISEFVCDPRSDVADASRERVLMRFRQPWANHNGGQSAFGPDGHLYIGTGDGGLANDPLGSGQDTKSLLGKMLRIAVDNVPQGAAYGIPRDNPFVGNPNYRPEIWATGLRNPWRFSFDRKTGLCYAGDVGQNAWEEISIIERGKNYGWNIMEGFHQFGQPRPTQGLALPIKEYDRNAGKSVTGGYVYRGKTFPALEGWSIYGDYETRRIWGLKYVDGKVVGDALLLQTNIPISSFGEDADGEIYVCDYARGKVYRIVPAQ